MAQSMLVDLLIDSSVIRLDVRFKIKLSHCGSNCMSQSTGA